MKSPKAICLTILLFITLFGVATPSEAREEMAKYVSIINLITTPEKYHNKKVLIEGYAQLDFENNALYLSREDAEYGATKNGILLLYDESEKEKYLGHLEYSHAYVFVQGILKSGDIIPIN